MLKHDVDLNLKKIDHLVKEMNELAPSSAGFRITEFRADLAGMLVVMIVASYENCIKEALVDYAQSHHVAFGHFAERNFNRINSRIRIDHLVEYCDLYGSECKDRFKSHLSSYKRRVQKFTGQNIESSYKQILAWRHAFAHAGERNTTVEEAFKTHRLARHVIYAFSTALHS